MEGFLLALSLSDAKKVWQTEFVKLDDISAQLLGFTDRTQAELKWKLHLKNADIATPLPDDPNYKHVPNVENTAHCFYVHEVTSCGQEVWVFLSAPDDESKKLWMKRLLQAAKDGPMPPRFGSSALSPKSPTKTNESKLPPYQFQARVTQVRLHEGGKHAEYMVTCHCAIFSRVADHVQSAVTELTIRRLTKEWNVWHRFSEFDALNEALKKSLGPEKLADVPFFKTHRDALRSLFGWWSLDQDFLDHRRLLLDTFVSRVCLIDGAVDFFQPQSDANLKKFFAFDEHCEDLDHANCPRKTSRPADSEAKPPGKEPPTQLPTPNDTVDMPQDADLHLRTSDMSPRDSDTSASFSSAIMSPSAAVAASSSVPSPSKAKSVPVETPVATVDDPATEGRRESESKRSKKKKNKAEVNAAVAGTKDATPATQPRAETEVVRQPTPTGGKEGKKRN